MPHCKESVQKRGKCISNYKPRFFFLEPNRPVGQVVLNVHSSLLQMHSSVINNLFIVSLFKHIFSV